MGRLYVAGRRMAQGAPGRLIIPVTLAREMEASLRRALPQEGCGLLAGKREEGGAAIAVRYVAGTNLDASPLRYTMDPAQVARAFDEFERDGLSLVAIAHSHPEGPARPSPTDLREYHYPDALMLVADLSGERAHIRAWRIDPILRRPGEAAVEFVEPPATLSGPDPKGCR